VTDSLARLRAYIHRQRHPTDDKEATSPVDAVYVLGDMLGHEPVLVALCEAFGTKMYVAPQCSVRRRQLHLLDETRHLLTGANGTYCFREL